MAWTAGQVVQRLYKLKAPKVLAFACLLLLWNTSIDHSQELFFIESFAGNAEATRSVQSTFPQRMAVALDLKYSETLDINSNSGMGAALVAVLKGDADGFVHWMGIQCSTWIGTSRGSTGRSKSNPLGVDSESNRRANLMTARLALLCLLTVALNGTFVIEQPISSLIMHHPRMQCLHASFEIYRCGFWMWWYGARTPKRTVLWSSSRAVGQFWTRRLQRVKVEQARALDPNPPQPVKKYKDSEGKPRYHGTADLTKTEHYPKGFGKKIASLLQLLKPRCEYVSHDDDVDSIKLFESWPWDDWEDVQLRPLIHYLYGSTSLRIPVEWRPVLPKHF
ncbi:unnamed protein product [Durusdinium trenchii]|uniref:Uncharacterized protein n=3 Tax=Durusdinium trenchii TaxID=1381693 RepID=A0ABP0LD76_9DINO